jgi:hypothetical protein
MTELLNIDKGILIALIGLCGSIISSYVAYRTTIKNKEVNRLRTSVTKLRTEVKARQCEEEEMSKWLVEAGICKTELTAKRELRARTKEKHGISPSMSPSELE